MPGEVPAGPCPVERPTLLLWHLAQPQASSSHQGLIFICRWVTCWGGTGLAARSGQHPYLAFTLSSRLSAGAAGHGTLSALSASLAGFGAGERKVGSHSLRSVHGGLGGSAALRPPAWVAPVAPRHPPVCRLQQGCPQAALGSHARLPLCFLAGLEGSPPAAGQLSQPPRTRTAGTQDQRAPCLRPAHSPSASASRPVFPLSGFTFSN